MTKRADETKRQRLAFEFFGEHFRDDLGESDKDYLDRVVAWFGQQVRGYSISHVHGRFRGEDRVSSMQDAAALQERAGRYLIDETTAITRFISPAETKSRRKR